MRKAKLVVTFALAPSYDVRIGSGVLAQMGANIQQACANAPAGNRVLLLTDDTAAPEAVDTVKTALSQAGFRPAKVSVSPDNALETVGELWAAMAQLGLDSASVLVVMGDAPLLNLAGFAGTAFGGGLRCVYAPTTLAAAVSCAVSDQAVLEVKGANGQVKADIHPLYSCIDLDLFASLSADQWMAGFELVAQAALLDSDDFFFWLSDNASALRNRDEEAVCEALVRTLSFRSSLSAAAEQQGEEAWNVLAYGSEFASAMGASLADGMRFSALLSHFEGLISSDIIDAQDALLTQLGFIQQTKVSNAQVALRSFNLPGGVINLMLPTDIGACRQVLVPAHELLSCLEAF